MKEWLWRRFAIWWHFERGAFWVRVFGWGVCGLHRSCAPLFSEREGFRRYWPAYPRTAWRFGLLSPVKRED